MIKKIFLGFTGILIVCDLIFIGVSASESNSQISNTKNPSIYSSSNSGISPIDARTIAENKANGGIVTSLSFNKPSDQYTATLDTINDTYSTTINAKNGDVITFTNEHKKPSANLDFTPNSASSNGQNFVPVSSAIQMLEKLVPDGTINELAYNIVGVEPQYDSTITKGNKKYYIDLNAFNNNVITKYTESLDSPTTV